MNSLPPYRRNKADSGSALLAVLLIGVALALLSAVLSEVVRTAALEHRARRNALCARYAALSGLAVGPDRVDLAGGATEQQTTVTVWYESRANGVCMLRSRGRCGDVTRTLQRTIGSPQVCLDHAPTG